MLLVSSHGGDIFDLVRGWLQANKEQFCIAMGLICEIVDVTKPAGSGNGFKYLSLQSAFARHPTAAGAFWIDGDTWLHTGPNASSSFKELVRSSWDSDFLVGRCSWHRMKRPDGSRYVRGLDEDLEDTFPGYGPCINGVNAGVFWVRHSDWTLKWLQDVANDPGMVRSDQCVLNRMLRWNNTLRSRSVIIPYNRSRLVQCRRRCTTIEALCYRPDCWLEHWPAHSRWELFLRVLHQVIGVDELTTGFCEVAKRMMGDISICRYPAELRIEDWCNVNGRLKPCKTET